MKMKYRLAYKFIAEILIPRAGSTDYVTDLDAIVLWHVVNEKEISFPHLMINVMKCTHPEIRSHPKKGLKHPYALLLTKLFEHSKIDLSLE